MTSQGRIARGGQRARTPGRNQVKWGCDFLFVQAASGPGVIRPLNCSTHCFIGSSFQTVQRIKRGMGGTSALSIPRKVIVRSAATMSLYSLTMLFHVFHMGFHSATDMVPLPAAWVLEPLPRPLHPPESCRRALSARRLSSRTVPARAMTNSRFGSRDSNAYPRLQLPAEG